ncbi:G protein-coupled receptor 65 [Menidia menidia]
MAANYSECFSVDSIFRNRMFMFFYLAVIIVAVPANIFSLYVSWIHIRHKNNLGVYLFNLALCDLTLTVGLSLWLDFLWKGVWTHGSYICMLSVYCLYTNFYISEALLCCVAVSRYLAVVHPLKYGSLRKVGTAAAVTVAVWVLVACLNVSTITWEESYYETKKIALCFGIFLPTSKNLVHAAVARLFLGFVIPVVLVIFCTWRIRVAVKNNQATKKKERRHISKLLTVVLSCLLFCFGPIHVIMLLHTLVNDCESMKWIVSIYKICDAVTTLNCLVDPLLYCFITRTGKDYLRQATIRFQGKRENANEGIS